MMHVSLQFLLKIFAEEKDNNHRTRFLALVANIIPVKSNKLFFNHVCFLKANKVIFKCGSEQLLRHQMSSNDDGLRLQK